MTAYPELERLSLEELKMRFRAEPPVGREFAAAYYEELAHRIRQHGTEGASFLLRKADGADEKRLRAILSAISYPRLRGPQRHEVLGVLRTYLNDSRPMLVQEAVDGLGYQMDRESLDQVLALLRHQSPYVRGSVLRYISRIARREAPVALVAALSDADPIVRQNAIDELDDLGAVSALLHIRPLLRDPHPEVQEAARTAVKELEDLLGRADGNSNTRPEQFEQLDIRRVGGASDFEKLCLAILMRSGYEGVPAKEFHLRTVDIVALDTAGRLVVVECKWLPEPARAVGVDAVHGLLAAVEVLRAQRGMLITTGRISAAARVLAASTNIEVLDMAGLRGFVQRISA
jgi:Restriction endonuclease/HEAT repeats